MKRWLYPLLLLLLGSGASAVIFLISSPPRGTAVMLLPPPTPVPILVDVHGAVQTPGVYALPQDSRVKDAIEAAGGMTAESDRDAVNLAARLKDGDKLTVPIIGDEQAVSPSPLVQSAPDSKERTNSMELLPPGKFININTATTEELEVLPGIGPTLAGNIIAQREKIGQFKTIEEVLDVTGIGPAKFDQIKALITVE